MEHTSVQSLLYSMEPSEDKAEKMSSRVHQHVSPTRFTNTCCGVRIPGWNTSLRCGKLTRLENGQVSVFFSSSVLVKSFSFNCSSSPRSPCCAFCCDKDQLMTQTPQSGAGPRCRVLPWCPDRREHREGLCQFPYLLLQNSARQRRSTDKHFKNVWFQVPSFVNPTQS